MRIVYQYIRAVIKRLLKKGIVTSYSHQGEDAPLQAILRWVSSGTYVDVGAYHPIHYSNTYAFYRKGWNGIVIDPNSDMRPLYRLLRPRDQFVHTAIGSEVGEHPYYMFADGAYNSFDENRARGWEQSRGLHVKEIRTVAFKPLALVLKEQGITHIDLLNIDVEGLDFEVLKTHDWTILPRVIAIEDEEFNPDAPHDSPIYMFLFEKGYILGGLGGNTLIFKIPKKEDGAVV